MLDVLQSNSFRVCAQCAVWWWWWGSADSLLLTLFTCQKFVPAQLSPPLCKYHYSSFFCDTLNVLLIWHSKAKQRRIKQSLHYHQSPPSTLLLSVRVFDKYYNKELTLLPPPAQSGTLGTTHHTLDMRVTFPLSLPRSELCLSRDLGVRREDVMIGRGHNTL